MIRTELVSYWADFTYNVIFSLFYRLLGHEPKTELIKSAKLSKSLGASIDDVRVLLDNPEGDVPNKEKTTSKSPAIKVDIATFDFLIEKQQILSFWLQNLYFITKWVKQMYMTNVPIIIVLLFIVHNFITILQNYVHVCVSAKPISSFCRLVMKIQRVLQVA